eukprot:196262-Rhodomonas_salina.1
MCCLWYNDAVYGRGEAISGGGAAGGECAVYGDGDAIFGGECAVYGDGDAVYGDNAAIYGGECAIYDDKAAAHRGQSCSASWSKLLCIVVKAAVHRGQTARIVIDVSFRLTEMLFMVTSVLVAVFGDTGAVFGDEYDAICGDSRCNLVCERAGKDAICGANADLFFVKSLSQLWSKAHTTLVPRSWQLGT